ncbi:hypothetical protein TF3313_0445 [Tannerella forsythia 3313]|nr:hypothetical protein TF3313_0445 [Tannerella forsythia 3313]
MPTFGRPTIATTFPISFFDLHISSYEPEETKERICCAP